MDYREAEKLEAERASYDARGNAGQASTLAQDCQAQTSTPRPGQGIGWAIKNMHHGLKVRRRGWNGRGMWLAIQHPDLGSKMTDPYVYMCTVNGSLIPWLCSQTDLLANDWEVATI